MSDVRIQANDVRVADPDARRATFTISTSARDAHGTVLNQNAWNLERYKRNPIVGYQHAVWGAPMCNDPNPDMVIGRSDVRVEGMGRDARLIADAEFEPREVNELADKIWKKIAFGSMRATSVGFEPIGEGRYGDGEEAHGEANETYYFAGQSLFEWSIVNMGSNPETVKRDAEQRARRFLATAVAGMRSLGQDVRLEDVMSMTVQDALRLFEGSREFAPLRSTTREERRRRVAEYIKASL